MAWPTDCHGRGELSQYLGEQRGLARDGVAGDGLGGGWSLWFGHRRGAGRDRRGCGGGQARDGAQSSSPGPGAELIQEGRGCYNKTCPSLASAPSSQPLQAPAPAEAHGVGMEVHMWAGCNFPKSVHLYPKHLPNQACSWVKHRSFEWFPPG